MDFLDEINEMAKSTGAQAGSGFAQHPPGQFKGTVTDVAQKTINDKVAYEIEATTDKGKASTLIFAITEADVSQAKIDDDHKQKILKTVARAKRLFVDLHVSDRDDVAGWAWHDGSERSIVGQLKNLKGKACTVVVQPRRDDATKYNTFLNAPSDNVVGEVAPPSTTTPGASGPSLDDIPF